VASAPQSPATLAHLRRARDLMDRDFAQPLDVPAMAAKAFMSPAHFSREFKAAYGETPYAYLMTRRIERAMALLRAGSSVTDACTAVGATPLRPSRSACAPLAGEPPRAYPPRPHAAAGARPACAGKLPPRPAGRD